MRFSVLSLIYPSSVSQEASGNEDIRIRKPGSVYYLLNSGDCSLYIDPGGRVHSQACLTLYDPMDCSPPGSSVRGIFQARILKWVTMPFSRGSCLPRDRTRVSFIFRIGRWVLYHQHCLGSSHRSISSCSSKVEIWASQRVVGGLPWWSSG